jgi:hypothetical protein
MTPMVCRCESSLSKTTGRQTPPAHRRGPRDSDPEFPLGAALPRAFSGLASHIRILSKSRGKLQSISSSQDSGTKKSVMRLKNPLTGALCKTRQENAEVYRKIARGHSEQG